MKKIYESPALQKIEIGNEDVIRTSQLGVQDSYMSDIDWDLIIR